MSSLPTGHWLIYNFTDRHWFLLIVIDWTPHPTIKNIGFIYLLIYLIINLFIYLYFKLIISLFSLFIYFLSGYCKCWMFTIFLNVYIVVKNKIQVKIILT